MTRIAAIDHVIGDAVAASAAPPARRAVRVAVWGEGWADAPATTLYSGFARPEDDELVFLTPCALREAATRDRARALAFARCAEPARDPRLAHMRRAASRLMRAHDDGAAPERAAALRAGVATCVNAAYLWPSLAAAQEALAAAAWLGWLADGRAALLAPSLCEGIDSLLSEPALAEAVALAGGAPRLRRLTRATRADGLARTARPPGVLLRAFREARRIWR